MTVLLHVSKGLKDRFEMQAGFPLEGSTTEAASGGGE
jgi:hypothetical protein